VAKRGVHINVYKAGPKLWRCDLKINSSDTGGGLTARGVADEMKGYNIRHAIRGALTLAQQAVKNPAIAAAFPQYTKPALAALSAVQTAQKAGLLGKVKMQIKDPTLKKLVRELDEMEQGKRTAMSGGGVVLCDGGTAGEGDELGILPIALMMAPLAKKYGPVAAKAIAARLKARRAAKARAAAAARAAARDEGDDDDDDDDLAGDDLAGDELDALGAWWNPITHTKKTLSLAKKLSPTHQIAKRLLRKRRAARARAAAAEQLDDQGDQGDEGDEDDGMGYDDALEAELRADPPFGLSMAPGKFGLPVGNPHPFAASVEQQIEDGAMMGACSSDDELRRLVAMHNHQRTRARNARG
jgi:hypothetical protein